MLSQEKNYDFRKKLLKIHEENLRDYDKKPSGFEFEIADGALISFPVDAGDVVLTAIKDFVDYMFTSMGVSVMIKRDAQKQDAAIIISLSDNGKPGGYSIKTDACICIDGFDERGVAQGLYYLEDVMSAKKAPYIEKGIVKKEPLFSPRMVQSGYGAGNYPDAYLSAIAHTGMDAILANIKDIDSVQGGRLDLGELIYRAGKYGIDVYAYSHMKSEKHPDAPGAKDYYHGLYGKLFEKFPQLKGVVLVGESVQFPSKDRHTELRNNTVKPGSIDNIPSGKPNPGWWPCEDYPQWLEMVRDSIRSIKPDADIVFWTYNWGWAPEQDRIKLINSLPTDISLLVTYEMFEKYKVGDVTRMCTDYTLAFEGPGKYFISEAEAASKRGIRLYAMSNTAGLTWDIGVIPYEPMPYQWIKRYEGLRRANEKWGLCGLMESHHYGFYPSFISELAKCAFYTPSEPIEECLDKIVAKHFMDAPRVLQALQLWSEAITHYTICNEDQYGPFRIGTAYPLCLRREMRPPDKPNSHSEKGYYKAIYQNWDEGRYTPFSVRVSTEIESLGKMAELMDDGLKILKNIKNPSEKLLYLINLGQFIFYSVHTAINAKKWYMLRLKLFSENNREKLAKIVCEMENVANNEIENAEKSIPLVKVDSRLGWEPNKEYQADAERIRWKIKQVRYMLDSELSVYKNLE